MANNSLNKDITITLKAIKDTSLSALTGITTQLQNFGIAVDTFAVKGTQAAGSINKVVEGLRGLEGVSVPKGFKQLATGLEELSKRNTPAFVKRLQALSDVMQGFASNTKLPAITSLTNGLRILNKTNPDAYAKRLTILSEAMRSFGESNTKLPPMTSFSKGLQDLTKIDTQTTGNKLRILAGAISTFRDNTKLPPSKAFAAGLRDLSAIDTQTTGNKLRILAGAMTTFKDTAKLPGTRAFVAGLRDLSAIDTQTTGNKLRILAGAIGTFKSTIQLPGTKAFAEGLRELTKIDTQTTGNKLRILAGAISSFKGEVKLPGTKAFVEGLRNLTQIDTQTTGNKLRILSGAISTFKDTVQLPGTKPFVAGLRDLTKIDTQTTGNKLRILAGAISSFKDASQLPGTKAFTEGLRNLTKVDTQTTSSKLRTLAGAINSFGESVKLPNTKTFVEGLRELTKIDTQTTGNKLRILAGAINSFGDSVKLPGTKAFAEGLRELTKIDTQTTGNKLRVLAGALGMFGDTIKVPSIKPFAEGLRELTKIDTQATGNKLRVLSGAIKTFEESLQLPPLKSFVAGLRELMKMDTQTLTSKLRALSSAMATFKQQGTQNLVMGLAKLGVSATHTAQQLGGLQRASQKTDSVLGVLGARLKQYTSYRIIADSVMNTQTAMRGGITAIIDYSQALKDLQAITLATDNQVAIMNDAIKQTASDTKFLVTEVAEGMKILGQAGLSAVEASQTIANVANLATGTISDMKSTVDLVTTTMRVFNIEAANSQRIVDAFANAVNRSKLTIDKLRIAFNYVGPIARDAGLSFEEINASLMTLANSGLRASSMGTGLRRILAELSDPSEKFKNAAQAAGVAMYNLDPTSRSLSVVLDNLQTVISDTNVAFDLFGKRGAAAALALSKNTKKFKEAQKQVSTTGTAAYMAGVQMEGLGIIFKKVVGKAQLLMVALGDAGLTSILQGIGIILQSVLDLMTTFAESLVGKLTFAVVGTTAVVLSLSAAIHTVISALATMVTVQAAGSFLAMARAATVTTGALGGLATAITAVKLSFGTLMMSPATTAMGLRFTSAVAAQLAIRFAVLGGVVAAVGLGLYKLYDNIVRGSRRAAGAQLKLAGTYTTLQDSITSYQDRILDLNSDSDEYRQVGIGFKKELLAVANKYGEVSVEARIAAESINSVTGKVKVGSDAIQKYRKALDDLEFKAITRNIKETSKAIEDETGYWGRIFTHAADNFKRDIDNMSNRWTAFAYAFNRDSIQFRRAAGNLTEIKLNKEFEISLMGVASHMNNGTASVEVMLDTLRTLNEKANLTKFEKQMQASLTDTVQTAKRSLDSLEKKMGGKYNLNLDEAGFKALLKESKLVDAMADPLIYNMIISQYKLRAKAAAEESANIVAAFTSEFDILRKALKGPSPLGGGMLSILDYDPNVDAAKLKELIVNADKVTTAWIANQKAIKDTLSSTLSADDMLVALKTLYREEANLREDMQTLNQKLVKDPDSIRILEEQKALEQYVRDAASVKELENRNATNKKIANARYKAEKDLENAMGKAKKKAAKGRLAILKKEAAAQKRIETESGVAKKLSDAQLLLVAAKKDQQAAKDGNIIGAKSLAVHAAKTKARKEDQASLVTSIKTQEERLAQMRKEYAIIGESKDAKKIIATAEKDLQKTKKGLISVDNQMLNLSKKSIQLSKENTTAKEREAKAYRELQRAQQGVIYAQQRTDAVSTSKTDLESLKRIAEINKKEHSDNLDFLLEEHAVAMDNIDKQAQARADAIAEAGGEAKLSEETKTTLDTGDSRVNKEKLRVDKEFLVLQEEGRLQGLEDKKDILSEELRLEQEKYATSGENYQEYLAANLRAEKASIIGHKEAAKNRLDILTSEYKRGNATKEEVADAAEEAKKQGVTQDPSEFVAATGDSFDNLAEGFVNAGEKAMTFEEQLQSIGATAKVALVNGVTDAFMSMVDGTKTAKEAFTDMAKSFLKQIAQMIIQQTILNGLEMMGLGAANGGQIGGVFQPGTQALASGGTVHGSSPNSKADNIPAWLTAGEFVQPVASVRKYGTAFMESIRQGIFDPTKHLHKFAVGGMIHASNFIPKFSNGGGVQATTVNVASPSVTTGETSMNIVNVLDKNLMGDYLNTPEGERTFMNFISTNRTAFQGAMS